MTLDSTSLTIGQLCARRWRLEQDWRVARWHPRLLYQHQMRQAVYRLSNGDPADKVANTYATGFLEQARTPGLEVHGPINFYEMAQDWASALRVTVELLSRQVLLTVRPGRRIRLEKADTNSKTLISHSWAVQSFEDQSGCLHHWKAVERIDEDAIAKAGHSWVWADMAMQAVPLTLHLIETGPMRYGHLHGDLSRIYAHPELSNVFKFGKVNGHKLTPGWKPKFLQDLRLSSKDWVDFLARDKVDPIRHIPLRQPNQEQVQSCKDQIMAEARRLSQLPADFREIPMYRPACDQPYTCPWQAFCYSDAKSPADVGFIRISDQKAPTTVAASSLESQKPK